jgi:hypothetical protein
MTTDEGGMNGADHYREAERLLDEATARERDPRALWCLELARVHTALAQVAATALAADGREWAGAGQDLNSRAARPAPSVIAANWMRR